MNNNSLNISTKKFSRKYIYFFIILHVVYDLDFGFLQRPTPRSKLIVKILTLTKCVCVWAFCVVVLGLYVLDEYYLASIIHSFSNVIILVIVLTFSHESSFYRLQVALFFIDSMIESTCSFNIEAKVVLAILVGHLYAIIPFLTMCYRLPEYCVGSLLYLNLALMVLMNIVITVCIICFFMFYTVYCRMRVFVIKMKINGGQMLESLNVYKATLDALDSVKKSFDYLYATALVFQTPLLVSGVHLYLRNLKSSHGIIYDDLLIIFVPMLVLIFAPPLTAGLLASKAEELKQILQDKLLSERDEPHSSSIKLFLDYMRGRPMKFTVFGSIPLDWSLLVAILNLCITYQIAIVQLTHLYD